MTTKKPGTPLSPGKKNVKIDGRRMFASLAKAAIGGVAAWAELIVGGSGNAGLRMAGGAFADLLTSIKVEDTDESKAWALISLSIAGAIEELRPKRIDRKTQRRVDKAFERLRKETEDILKEDAEFVIDPDFFLAPHDSDIYQRLRPALIEGLRVYFARDNLDSRVVDLDIGGRLDIALNATVYRVMQKKAADFESLKASIISPGYAAARHEYDWSVYRTSLRERFEVEPVFGQEATRVALKQLYVEPRAAWANAEAVETVPRICEPMHDILRDWINGTDGPRLKLVVGGPGSGKSSFAKAFAAEIANHRASIKPIYVPLHRIGVSLDNRDNRVVNEQLNDFLKQHAGFSQSPLELDQNGNEPFLFLFDGLDEMVVPGGAPMTSVAERFTRWLDALLEVHRGARAIVLGRTIMMSTFERLIATIKRSDVYHLMGLAPLPDTMRRATKDRDFALIEADQREKWWYRYALAVNEDPELPLLYKAIEFESLTNEPLLCYLLAISETYKESIKTLSGDEASLYANLIDSIWRRGWGDPAGPLSDGRVGPGARLSKDEYNQLMEAISYSAWIGGTLRVASQSKFEGALDFLNLRELWNRFNTDMDRDLATLALTFYLKGSEDENGFEFTHRTFAEFLLARLLLMTFVEVCIDFENLKTEFEDQQLRWLVFVGDGEMDPKLVEFLRLIARTLPEEQIQRVTKSGQDLLEAMISHGLPTHRMYLPEKDIEAHRSGPTIMCGNDLERLQRNAQTAFLACYSAILYSRVESPEPIAVGWLEQTAPGILLSRLVTSRKADGAASVALAGLAIGRPEDHPKGIFSPLLSGIFLSGADLSNTSFSTAQLDLANFSSCSFTFAEFIDAICDRSDFTQSTVVNGCFNRASLRGTIWNGANVRSTEFHQANLEYAILSDSQFNECDFTESKLIGMLANEADFSNCNFRFAKLEEADFTGSTIDGADFSQANLAFADFTGVDMRPAKFDGANFWNAIVEKEMMPEDFEERVVIIDPNDFEQDTDDYDG